MLASQPPMSSVDELESLSASDVFGITEEDIHELKTPAQECIAQGIHEAAQDTLLTLISVCPDDELITIVYAELMIELGDSEEAEMQLVEFLGSHPDNFNALIVTLKSPSKSPIATNLGTIGNILV